MLIDINDSGSGSYLCQDCRFKNLFSVKSKCKVVFCKCPKWGTTVQNVGVCKYFEQEITQDVDIEEKI